jgi:5-methylcytosine-specific restriction endonuclease McrA
MSKFNKDVLVLNKAWQPINIKNVYNCVKDVLKGRALFADDTYTTYDFITWIEYSNMCYEEDNTLLHFRLNEDNVFLVPEVLKMETPHYSSYRAPRLSKINVLRRDHFTCQYCGKTGSKDSMNVDHVIPKSHGGKGTWMNLVASCKTCNHEKADRTPKEAGLKLRNEPYKPQWNNILDKLRNNKNIPDSWKVYIGKQ